MRRDWAGGHHGEARVVDPAATGGCQRPFNKLADDLHDTLSCARYSSTPAGGLLRQPWAGVDDSVVGGGLRRCAGPDNGCWGTDIRVQWARLPHHYFT